MRPSAAHPGVWRQRLAEEVAAYPHPSWGPSHCRRTYELALGLAGDAGERVDEELLFALAYVHDLGAFEPFASAGTGTQEASAHAAEEVLPRVGLPEEKRERAIALVRSHSWESDPGPSAEGRFFRDADMLDFMGAIGITRILAIVGLEEWTPGLPEAVAAIEAFARDVPGSLLTEQARLLAEQRRAETDVYLTGLRRQTSGLRAL